MPKKIRPPELSAQTVFFSAVKGWASAHASVASVSQDKPDICSVTLDNFMGCSSSLTSRSTAGL